MMMKMGVLNHALAVNLVTILMMNPHLTWNQFPMTRYEFSCSSTILSAYPIFLQLINPLPRKTVVDLSHGSHKQLRKKASHKCKATKAQSVPLASTSKRARVTMEETPDEQVGGLVHSSSMMSIESLLWKVSNVHHSLCLNLINLVCTYSRQENKT